MQRGLFAVAKPAGVTSAAVTNRIKAVLLQEARKNSPDAASGRHSPKIKVGHGGTLDKGASGVLVIGVGRDCKRLADFLASDKCYECVGRLGEARDTLDMDGSVVEMAPWDHVTQKALSEALVQRFTGTILQSPPVYSAIKHKGSRSSDLARRGILFVPSPREVTVHSATLVKFQPPFFEISIHCTSGTYIRSIVHELGKYVGSAAYVTELRRTRQGQFELRHALPESKWNFSEICKAAERYHS